MRHCALLLAEIFFFLLYGLFLPSIRYLLFSLGWPHSIFPTKLYICLHSFSEPNFYTLKGVKRQLQNSPGFGLYRKSTSFYTEWWSAGRRLFLKNRMNENPVIVLGMLLYRGRPPHANWNSTACSCGIFQLIWQRVRGATSRRGREWCQETGSASLGTGQHFAC